VRVSVAAVVVAAAAGILTGPGVGGAAGLGARPVGAAPAAVSAMPGPYVDQSKIPNGVPGVSTATVRHTGEQPKPDNDVGAFRTVCDLAKMDFVDPIVKPGQVGASHLHAFYGNTSVDAFSTNDSLRSRGNGTCRGGTANRSAYWIPAVIKPGGVPLRTSFSQPYDKPFEVYYKSGYGGLRADQMQDLPAQLRIVAGDATASGPQGGKYDQHLWWDCEATPGVRSYSIPACPVGSRITMVVVFPQCGDGRSDSPDHHSHMAYLKDGKCPAGYGALKIPEITFLAHYQVRPGDNTRDWRLSSDMYPTSTPGGYSAHADIMVGWDRTIHHRWMDACLRARADCHSGLIGGGDDLVGTV
jgi:hypothetical protein